MSRGWRIAAVLLSSLALTAVVAGCGDDESETTTTAPTTTGPTGPTGTEGTTTERTETETGGEGVGAADSQPSGDEGGDENALADAEASFLAACEEYAQSGPNVDPATYCRCVLDRLEGFSPAELSQLRGAFRRTDVPEEFAAAAQECA